MDNIISLEQKAEQRRRRFKEKAVKGINSLELQDYYDKVIKNSIQHLSFLQRYIVEEFLYDVVEEVFYYGVELSKQCLHGRKVNELIDHHYHEADRKVRSLFSKHMIYQYLRDLDMQAVMIIADDITVKWFEKGLEYGKKQRKLKLL
ncbi:MAG: DUF2521 family protein [Bacillaceae bacterium]|nr:DUF2521 family protein [Bacillaceae bacterium]